ncbi:MAG: hypothetical protein GC204_19840 [Chloroflexi bacterium]|nr:hypothetical protein [Chloroflexota bacterium]
MFRKLFALSLIVFALSSFSLVAFAQDDAGEDLAHFTDGRVNAYDIAAPVAIFYNTESRQVFDDNGQPIFNDDGTVQYRDVPTSISFYGIDSEGNIYDVMTVTTAQVTEALANEQSTFVSQGFMLGIGSGGWYFVSGHGYSFEWDDLGRTLPVSYTLPQA